MSTRLAHQTQKTAGIPNGMRTATVTAVNNGVPTLSIAGGQISSGVGVVAAYSPAVGDVVAVFRQDSSWLVLGVISRRPDTGTVNFTFNNSNSSTATVPFDTTYPTAPVVTTNIDSGAGSTARWISRAINISTSGFTLFVFAADAVANTWSAVPVSWTATAR